MSDHRKYPEYDIAHYTELVTNSEEKLRQAIERLSDATHKVAEAETEVAQHKALLEYQLIEFEKKPKQESSSDAIKHEASSSLKETPLYAIGSPVYVKRTNGTESIAFVKNYDANSKLYTLDLDTIDSGKIKQCRVNAMRGISHEEYEAIQRTTEELRSQADDKRREAELELAARLRGEVGMGAPYTSRRSKEADESSATKGAKRRIARAKARSEALVTLTGGRRNTKKYRRRNKRKTKHYKKKTKRYTKKRNMRY